MNHKISNKIYSFQYHFDSIEIVHRGARLPISKAFRAISVLNQMEVSMKKLVLLAAMLLLIGCGKENVSGGHAADPDSDQYIVQTLNDVGLSVELHHRGPVLACQNTFIVSNDVRVRTLENLLKVIVLRQNRSPQQIAIKIGADEVSSDYLLFMFEEGIRSLTRNRRNINGRSCDPILAKLIKTKPKYLVQRSFKG